jgi:hypothetical protein
MIPQPIREAKDINEYLYKHYPFPLLKGARGLFKNHEDLL